VHRADEVDEAIASFGATPVVVKPSGLTGGKGVKVMGPHLASHADARDYALSLLAGEKAGDSVLIEEKIVGAEFTIQAISDGRTVVFPTPPTTTPTALTATPARVPAAWARCRPRRPRFRS